MTTNRIRVYELDGSKNEERHSKKRDEREKSKQVEGEIARTKQRHTHALNGVSKHIYSFL